MYYQLLPVLVIEAKIRAVALSVYKLATSAYMANSIWEIGNNRYLRGLRTVYLPFTVNRLYRYKESRRICAFRGDSLY